jgi:signal transduction histidine kinase
VMKLQIERVDLVALCREAVENASFAIGARSVTVESTEEKVEVDADRYLMLRIIQNVMSNALKYTHQTDGVIKLTVERIGENATVAISDNGPGIPPEYHKRIFDRFVQVEGTRIPGVHSTGLGLSLVKLGIEAHGGSVSLESELGKGTTFRLNLPQSQPVAA